MSQTALLTAPMVNPFPHQRTVFECIQLAGTQANYALITALTMQVYRFYVCFPDERAWIKALGNPDGYNELFFLHDYGAEVGVAHRFRRLLVVGNDNSYLGRLERIYILKGDRLWARFVASLIVLLALMQSLAGIINEAPIAKNQELSTMKNLLIGARVWLIGSAVCDLVITSSMIFIFDQYRRRTPWKQTDTIIKKLIFNTVETGAVTTIVAIVEAILFVLYPTNNLGQFPLNVRADMAPASLIATPYTEEIHWGQPDREQVTDLEALRTVHSTARVSIEISPEKSNSKPHGLGVLLLQLHWSAFETALEAEPHERSIITYIFSDSEPLIIF
ncbi:hypothetical protein B0H11DRAFT_1941847 [Mycena galericulata]|nr:hypothetical protein B0H11DRAFT_1941847 [Mycena galericulata]